jgi:hypothetical protein
MRGLSVVLAVVGLAAFAGVARAQTAMPDFSNPYGGVSSYVNSDPIPAPKPVKKAAKKSSEKTAHNVAQKPQVPKPVDLDDAALAPSDPTKQPLALSRPSQTSQKDSALGLDLKWSASSDPIYNPATSTIPGVDQVKRSMGDTSVETGSSLEAGVKLKF